MATSGNASVTVEDAKSLVAELCSLFYNQVRGGRRPGGWTADAEHFHPWFALRPAIQSLAGGGTG